MARDDKTGTRKLDPDFTQNENPNIEESLAIAILMIRRARFIEAASGKTEQYLAEILEDAEGAVGESLRFLGINPHTLTRTSKEEPKEK